MGKSFLIAGFFAMFCLALPCVAGEIKCLDDAIQSTVLEKARNHLVQMFKNSDERYFFDLDKLKTQKGALSHVEEVKSFPNKLTCKSEFEIAIPFLRNEAMKDIGNNINSKTHRTSLRFTVYKASKPFVQVEMLKESEMARKEGQYEEAREEAIAFIVSGDAMRQAGDRAGALSAYIDGLRLFKDLAAKNKNNTEVKLDVTWALNKVGDGKLLTADKVGALAAYAESLNLLQEQFAQDKSDDTVRERLVSSLAHSAFLALFDSQYTISLKMSDQAIELAQGEIWLQANRAHALMMMGRDDEARDLYRKYRGENAKKNTLWEKLIKDDFGSFRQQGINRPLMKEVEGYLSAQQ